MKLRQLHPEHWYRKQSVPVDHGQCRTSDDICFTLYCLRFWRSWLGQTKLGIACLLTQSLCDLSYLLFTMCLSQYCDVCSDISALLWQLDTPSASDELLSRLPFIHLRSAPAERSFDEICDGVQGLDLALDLDTFVACLQRISAMKFSDEAAPSYGTVVDNTYKLFSLLNINDLEVTNWTTF